MGGARVKRLGGRGGRCWELSNTGLHRWGGFHTLTMDTPCNIALRDRGNKQC